MAESPPRGDGTESPDADRPEKGESDPLFHPANLKTRKTVMGLAPAPHLGGASRPLNEAEARKQRVLARLAAMEGPKPQTGPPPPGEAEAAKAAEPSDMANIGITTTIMETSNPGAPRRISSDGRLPAESGWDTPAQEVEAEIVVSPNRTQPPPRPPLQQTMQQPPPAARPSQAPPKGVVNTEIMESAPITARMIRTPQAVHAPMVPSSPPPAHVPAPQVQAAPLALRPYEPSYGGRPPPPPLTGPFDARLALLTDPHSQRSASFRLLRDSLIGKSMPRVVAVSSPAPNDGKTTCAVNLALAFSELQQTRVLLIDGNFFEPELGELFKSDKLTGINPPGGDAWLAPYKLFELTATLHLAAMAKVAGARFDQQRFEGMIERLVRISYDYIIIDAPAMRSSPAVIQMLASADSTLLAIRSGVSTGRDLRRATKQIPENKAIGVALIDALPQQ